MSSSRIKILNHRRTIGQIGILYMVSKKIMKFGEVVSQSNKKDII